MTQQYATFEDRLEASAKELLKQFGESAGFQVFEPVDGAPVMTANAPVTRSTLKAVVNFLEHLAKPEMEPIHDALGQAFGQIVQRFPIEYFCAEVAGDTPDLPFGGAMDIAEAEQNLGLQEDADRIARLQDILAGVLNNILSSGLPFMQRSELLLKAVAEFKRHLLGVVGDGPADDAVGDVGFSGG